MSLLVAVLSFVAGALSVGALSYRWFSRRQAFLQPHPLDNPPNHHVANLRDAVQPVLDQWCRPDFRFNGQLPRSAREALHSLYHWSNHSAVWVVKEGWLTLPDGRLIPIRQLAQQVDAVLMASYSALDEARGVVLDYADRLPVGTAEAKGHLLASCRNVVEPQLDELARLLGLPTETHPGLPIAQAA